MELKVNEVTLPAPITFNFEELKAELLQKVAAYESMVYTEDQIKSAKADRAALNRLKKALNDERIRREKDYMQPFEMFRAQINELIKIIDKSVVTVDKQVKGFEEQRKADKLKAIEEYWSAALAESGVGPISFKLVFVPTWLNTSVSFKSIQADIDAKLEECKKDLALIDSLPAFAFEARECYVDTLDLARAISEAHRLKDQAEKKAAWEAKRLEMQQARSKEPGVAEEPNSGIEEPNSGIYEQAEPVRQWIGFEALLSAEEARALGVWFKNNGIKYRKPTKEEQK